MSGIFKNKPTSRRMTDRPSAANESSTDVATQVGSGPSIDTPDQFVDELLLLIDRAKDMTFPDLYGFYVRGDKRVNLVINGMLLIHVTNEQVTALPTLPEVSNEARDTLTLTNLLGVENEEDDEKLGGLSVGQLHPSVLTANGWSESSQWTPNYLLFTDTSGNNYCEVAGSCSSFEEAVEWANREYPCHVYEVSRRLIFDAFKKDAFTTRTLSSEDLQTYLDRVNSAIHAYRRNDSTQCWRVFRQTPDRFEWLDSAVKGTTFTRLDQVRAFIKNEEIAWSSAFELTTKSVYTFHPTRYGLSTRRINIPDPTWFDLIDPSP
jgi:hypothetical protein